MGTIKSVADIFEDMLGSINYDSLYGDLYNFKIRLGVIKYRPPRHKFFEYMRTLGVNNIDAVLNHKPLMNPEQLIFVFPEAHMSVNEEQQFTLKLNEHPDVDKIKQVDILTKSPILISEFYKEMMVILTWDDDKILE